MSDFERITVFYPAFDRRAEGDGTHGVDLLMALRGDLGVVQFRLSTGWVLPETLGVSADDAEVYGMFGHRYRDAWAAHNTWLYDGLTRGHYPYPTDLGYHSPRAIYDGQEPMDCDLLPGGRCYYDGSTLNAERSFLALLQGGSDGVFEFLEGYYQSVFSPVEATA